MILELFTGVYTLSYPRLFCLCLCCLMLFRTADSRFSPQWWWRALLGCFLIFWSAAVLWATVLSRPGGFESEWASIPLHSYRAVLAGADRELLRSNLMNVILFAPAGLLTAALLPKCWTSGRKLFLVAVLFCLLSWGIECAQFTRGLGLAEVDDVIHNTLGAAVGTLLHRPIPLFFDKELLQ